MSPQTNPKTHSLHFKSACLSATELTPEADRGCLGITGLDVAELLEASPPPPSSMAAKTSTHSTGTDPHLETSFLISGLFYQDHGPSSELRGTTVVWSLVLDLQDCPAPPHPPNTIMLFPLLLFGSHTL